MVVLVGYSVAGRRNVVVVRSGRMSLSGQPRVVASACHDGVGQAVTRGETVSLSGALDESGTVDIL